MRSAQVESCGSVSRPDRFPPLAKIHVSRFTLDALRVTDWGRLPPARMHESTLMPE